MKRSLLAVALLVVGVFTGSPKVSAQQIEAINLGCTENLRIVFGQEAPDFCRSAEADSGLLFDRFKVQEKAALSIEVEIVVFNRGSADALVEVYDASGNLVDLKVIDGNKPETGLLQSGYDLFTRVPASFFSRYPIRYPIGDPRRDLKPQTVNVTIPAGGYVDITKSSNMAYWYNAIIAAVDLIQLAPGDPDFVQSQAMTKEVAMDFVKAWGDKAIVNIFKSEPVAEGIFSLDFLDRDKLIEVLFEFGEWWWEQESSRPDSSGDSSVDPSKSPLTGAFSDVFRDTANVGLETWLNQALPGLGSFARAVRQGGNALNTAARLGDLYHSYFVAQEKAVVSLRNTAAPSRNSNDAVAAVNQQLWGTWEVQNEAGQSSLLIFTPQGQTFLLDRQPSQSYLGITFQYEVNSSYQPMHMDWVDNRVDDRGMTIFEFTANNQLRLELANLNPGNRPSDFTGGGILFTKISNTANLPPNTEVIDVIDVFEQDNKARQVEARNNLGAMNRAQQAYYLEYARFTTTIEELRIGIRSETENYRYRITSGDPRVVAIVTATAKRPGLKSYTGVVWVSPRNGENFPYARLCETNKPSMSAPSITIPTRTNTGVEFQCGNESSEL